MRLGIFWCWVFAIAGMGNPIWAIADLPDTISRIKPAIVAVGTYQRTRAPSAVFRGTGFVVVDGLHVLTNAHVLPKRLNQEKGEILAVFYKAKGRDRLRRARVIGLDKGHDLALLRIGGPPMPTMPLGDSGRVREGEVYAFTGFPIGMVLGLYPVTHRGIISSITPIAIPVPRAAQLDPGMLKRLNRPYRVFQLDATAYPGNSGSPLYHPDTGEVVGIINKVFVKESKENLLSKPSGISYAVPIEYARSLLRRHQLQ
ncbi:MAG TPA: serine protease [Methylothermaceae bacterium]|nr:serine protease [Methylothermaceae bacterium]